MRIYKFLFSILSFFILFSVFYFSFSSVSYAADPLDTFRSKPGVYSPPITKLGDVGNPLEEKTLLNTFINFLKILTTVFWIVAVGFVIWSAFTFLFADGDEGKIGEAKNRLKYALIASGIGLLSGGIDIIVNNLLTGN